MNNVYSVTLMHDHALRALRLADETPSLLLLLLLFLCLGERLQRACARVHALFRHGGVGQVGCAAVGVVTVCDWLQWGMKCL